MAEPRRLGAYLTWLSAILLPLVLHAATVAATPAERPSPPDDPMRELALLMRTLDRTARVLYVTAHPDDEDAGLLAQLVHGEGLEVALLTTTRGEGGQNEIGTELFDALGVLRSRELEAAGRFTGVRQYFTRAFEFGYSFSVEETFEKWGHDAILRDMVRVVREFRPDVILTMLYEGDGGGQHHQASARLAAEAFSVAETQDWPELGVPHRTARLFRQVWDENEHVENHCLMELGIYDQVLGASYEEGGMESRAAHKCQGMARYSAALPSRLSRWEWRFARGETLGPVPHLLHDLPEPLLETRDRETDFGRSLRAAAERARAAYAAGGGDELVGELIEIANLVAGRRTDVDAATPAGADAAARLRTLEARVARAVQLAHGVRIGVRAGARHLAAGDTLGLEVSVRNAGRKPAFVTLSLGGPGAEGADVRYDGAPGGRGQGRMAAGAAGPGRLALEPGGSARTELRVALPDDARPTIARPVPRHGDAIDDEAARRFLRPAWGAFELNATLTLSGVELHLPPQRISHQELDASFPSIFYSDPHVVPDPSVRFVREVVPVAMTTGDGHSQVSLLVSSLTGGPMRVGLEVPEALGPGPEPVLVDVPPGGVEVPVRLALKVPGHALDRPEMTLRAYAHPEGAPASRSTSGVRRVEYRHIRPGALLVDGRARLVPFTCRVPDVHVGYVMGVGDRVPEALNTLGVPVDFLDETALLEGDLSGYDVIVTGIRAYNVRDDLASAHERLMAWVRAGGTMIVQYNKFEFNAGSEESPYAPFPGTRVGRRRVTVEESPVVVNAPSHPLLRQPNVIGPSDWTGWVQERGLYFLDVTDERYVDLLTLEDPWPKNAGPKGGALTVAPVGDGTWVYVGIGLFRQLPAGVPGAYRLLANLLALGGVGDAD